MTDSPKNAETDIDVIEDTWNLQSDAKLLEESTEEVHVIDEDDDDDPIRRGLLEDAEKVQRLIQNDGVNKSYEEVIAYLEVYVYHPNRLKIVVEELLGLGLVEDENQEQEPVTELEQVQYEGKGKGKGKGKSSRKNHEEESPTGESKGKGKGEGKNSKRNIEENSLPAESQDTKDDSPKNPCNDGEVIKITSEDELPDPEEDVVTLDDSSPESAIPTIVLPDLDINTLIDPPGVAAKSLGSHAISPDQPTQNSSTAGKASLAEKRGREQTGDGRNRSAKRRKTFLEDNMLHGPFDFKAHRSKEKPEKSSTNLRPGLDKVIEEVTVDRGSASCRSAPTGLGVQPPSCPARPNTSDKQPRVITATPPPPPHTVTTDNNKKEKEELINNLCMMFPNTIREYIQLRAEDLVGKPAALDRFMEELFSNPDPPPNWRQLYTLPGIGQLNQNDEVVVLENENRPLPVNRNIHDDRVELATAEVPQPVHFEETSDTYNDSNSGLPSESGSATPVFSLSRSNTPGSRPDTPSSSSHTPVDNRVNTINEVSEEEAAPSPGNDQVDRFRREKEDEMRSLFPEVSPDWISQQINEIVSTPFKDIQELINLFQTKVETVFNMNTEDFRSIPTYKDWERNKKETEELEKWTGQMTVETMLELFQDPISYFNDDSRVEKDPNYKLQCVHELQNLFRFQSNSKIEEVLKKGKGIFTKCYKILVKLPHSRKTKRKMTDIPTTNRKPCLQLLKEKKFVELEPKIKEALEKREKERKELIEMNRQAGLLKECQCCFSDECLDFEMISCNGKEKHYYCQECVSRGANVAIGDGKTVIQCLGKCNEEISWIELQRALPPNVLSKLLQKRQAEEVATAGLEGLVCCPFCPYVTIMENENDKVLACRNPDCGRESCRLCKEPNHVPLRCEEVETKDEESQRKKIEEQLSQAMIRECYKCHTKFLKEEGCNKMTCPKPGCGAKMCYLCKAPVKDYSHFYGQGSSPGPEKKCPLWSDSKTLHAKEVAVAAKKAREEMAESNVVLKESVDPTRGIPDPSTIKTKTRARQDNGWLGYPGFPNALGNQRIIENLIRARQEELHNRAAPNHMMQDMMARMEEIYRLREVGREQQRQARRAEARALRDLRYNQYLQNRRAGNGVQEAANPAPQNGNPANSVGLAAPAQFPALNPPLPNVGVPHPQHGAYTNPFVGVLQNPHRPHPHQHHGVPYPQGQPAPPAHPQTQPVYPGREGQVQPVQQLGGDRHRMPDQRIQDRRARVNALRGNINDLNGRLDDLQGNVNAIRGRFNALGRQGNHQQVQDQHGTVNGGQVQVQLGQDNVPRVQVQQGQFNPAQVQVQQGQANPPQGQVYQVHPQHADHGYAGENRQEPNHWNYRIPYYQEEE